MGAELRDVVGVGVDLGAHEESVEARHGWWRFEISVNVVVSEGSLALSYSLLVLQVLKHKSAMVKYVSNDQ